MSRWLLVALLTASGCAFSLDGPDPNRPRNQMPSCDTSKGAVALDGVMATAFGVATLGVAGDGGGAAALVPLGLGALYLGGAIAGNNAVNACRKAQAEYTESYGNERYAQKLDEDDEDTDDEDRQLPKRPRVKYDDARSPDVYSQPRPSVPVAPVATTTTPPAAPPTTTATVPTAPPATKPAAPATKPGKSRAPAKGNDDEWNDFWREVP